MQIWVAAEVRGAGSSFGHARLHNSETLRRVPDITEYRARLHVMALDRYRRDDAAAINTIASGSQQRTIKAMSHRIAVS